MEQQNKYYTPDISELHVGYECEHSSNMSAFICEDLDDVVKDKLTSTDLKWYITWGEEEGGLEKFVRTKYLDRSDIESLGWEYREDSFHRKVTEEKGEVYVPTHYWFTKPDTQMTLTWYPGEKVHIENSDPMWMLPSVKYSGECKSINELRKIMNWLNIK